MKQMDVKQELGVLTRICNLILSWPGQVLYTHSHFITFRSVLVLS